MATLQVEKVRDVPKPVKAVKGQPGKSEQDYKQIISKPPSVTSDAAIREYETALISLGELYRNQK